MRCVVPRAVKAASGVALCPFFHYYCKSLAWTPRLQITHTHPADAAPKFIACGAASLAALDSLNYFPCASEVNSFCAHGWRYLTGFLPTRAAAGINFAPHSLIVLWKSLTWDLFLGWANKGLATAFHLPQWVATKGEINLEIQLLNAQMEISHYNSKF